MEKARKNRAAEGGRCPVMLEEEEKGGGNFLFSWGFNSTDVAAPVSFTHPTVAWLFFLPRLEKALKNKAERVS